ncbi:hypothetical protein Tco_0717693, partial [Tanacetum coccineum]
MVKLKGKKKVEDDDEVFVVEEQHDEEDGNKNFELKFKSLRARTTVLPLYDATQSLSPERKSKIREMGFTSIKNGSFIANWIQNQNYTKKIREVLGIPMGKKKLESEYPRDFNDEFLTTFKKHFEGKKYPTTTDLSKVIKNIKSSDIISDFDWCSFIWDHIKTSKIGWDDRTLQN